MSACRTSFSVRNSVSGYIYPEISPSAGGRFTATQTDARGPSGSEAPVETLVERFDIEPFPDFFFSQISKLHRARSLLYRRQISQENIRWKALEEIDKIYILLHCSDLNISARRFRIFLHFFKLQYFLIFEKNLTFQHV